jgi:GT2 family glycosyltransferase
MADVSVVVVTLDALPWLERCLESVRTEETLVVDVGSTDGTLELVRERFPDARLLQRENRGLAAAWNEGIRETAARYVLLLNADAWLVDDALARLVAFADAHAEAAVVAPRLRNPDGSLQRSVRGFPTLWRLATEYLFLRKLAPRSRLLNAFYAGDFDHASVREAEFVMGAVMLVRRAAIDDAGLLDESFFLFSEETDWHYRFVRHGWKILFTPDAEAVHVGGAAHGGRLFAEQVRGHLRFLAKHHGVPTAERARRLLLVSLRLRGFLFRGERGRRYRDTARLLASGTVTTLLDTDRGRPE